MFKKCGATPATYKQIERHQAKRRGVKPSPVIGALIK